MLSGGQGDILPVMGGGFSLMALGEPSEPLPVHEGGAGEHAAALAARPVSEPVVEYYAVDQTANKGLQKYTDSVVKTMLQNSKAATDIKELKDEYVASLIKEWTQPPTMDKCVGDHALNNLVHYLPRGGLIDTIVVIPAIKGSLSRFDYFLTFLTTIGVISSVQDEIGTIMEKARVVFMPPLFGEGLTTEGSQNNFALQYMFMKLKNLNKGKVFALSDYSKDGLVAACGVNKTLAAEAADPLVPLLEPGFIMYSDPVGKFSKGILIKSKNPGVPPTQKAAEEYLSFGSSKDPVPDDAERITVTTTENTVVDGTRGSGQCSNLLTSLKVESLTTGVIGLDTGDRIAVIRLTTSSNQPLCKVKSILDGAPKFFSAEMRRTARAPKTNIWLNGQLYRIRKPLSKVVSNWAAGVFAPGGQEFRGEADFLNDIGLTPKLLAEVFDVQWVDRLTDFLKSVSMSRCFSDEALLTYSECSRAREFVRTVENYMLANETALEKVTMVDLAEPVTIPNTHKATLQDATPGGFSSEIKFGSNVVYATLTGWTMPVMVVNRSNGEYLLRQLVVDDTSVNEDDVRGFLKMYEQQYPGWTFLS